MRRVSYDELAREILAREPRCGQVRLVAIDGPGGSGKSVFAHRLAAALGGAPVVNTDDFASVDNPTNWWPRFEHELIEPLCAGRPVHFMPTTWTATQIIEPQEVAPAPVVIVEGVSSARRAAADRLSLCIWVEAPRSERLRRGILRDGESMRDVWLSWMAAEDAHYRSDDTRGRCDIVVDGAPGMDHDPDHEFVTLN